jgi:hypothetical protein
MALVVLVACRPRETHVRASVPGLDGRETPLAQLAFVALPYNRDSVLAAMEARAPTPRPHTRELDSLFRIWREPFARFARAGYRTLQLRDSLTALRHRLDSLPRNAPAYQRLYQRFAELTDSAEAARVAGEPARKELDQLRRQLLPKIDSLRRDVTAWENSTFQGYQSAVEQLSHAEEATADTTDAEGHAVIRLPDGRWWIYAWAWDEADPYSQWYWNVPVTGDTAVLDASTGKRRPRY